MDFNDIFRKDVAYDNIKSHKKSRFYPLSRKHTFGSYRGQFYGKLFRVNIAAGWRPATLLKRGYGTVVFL